MKTGLLVLVALAVSGTAHADGLEASIVAQARAQAKDASQVGDYYRGAGEKTDYQILLEANKCYWFAGASEGLNKLYMYLWKPNSNAFTPRVADMKSPGQGTMGYCTQVAGMYRFQVKSEGPGHFVVGLFAKDAPPQPVVEKVELGKICDARARGAAPEAHRVGDYFEGAGNSIGHDDRFDFPVQLDAGKCYWVIACGEPDHVKAISLYLWGPNNKRITEAKSDSSTPMIGHCAQETGMFKFQAKITGGGGHFKAALYKK